MVVAERKPLTEILEMLAPFKKILVAGCKGCVTVCTRGGRKEVEILASEIRISRKKAGEEAGCPGNRPGASMRPGIY